MARLFAVFLVLVCGLFFGAFPHSLRAEEKEAAKMEVGVWQLPGGVVAEANPADPEGKRNPRAGFVLKPTTYSVQYDATEFLKAQEVTFPPGSEAFYDEATNALVMRNTIENLDLVGMLIGGCGLVGSINVVVEVVTYECVLPAEKGVFPKRLPTYAELTSLPAEDVRLLDRVSAGTKSGVRVALRKTLLRPPSSKTSSAPATDENESAYDSEEYAPGETGSIIDVEPVIGPDGLTTDAIVNYRFRKLGAEGAISEISFKTNFIGQENYPVVLYVTTSPTQRGKSVVVTCNVRVVNQGGWPQKQLEAAGDKN